MKKFISTLAMLSIILTLSAQEQKQEQRREIVIKKEGFMKANPAALAPKFSPEQQKQMAEFKLELQKEMLQLHNQLGEKKAQLKTLQQVEKPNMKSIYSKIDEISDLQNREMKLMADHQNKVRSILTDEQRVKFDMNQGRLCMQHKMQGRPGEGNGMHKMRQGMRQGAQPPKMMMKMNHPDSMKMMKK